MPGFIPLFILVGAAIAVIVLQFVPKGTGIAWLVALVSSLAAWIFTLIIKSRLPFSYSNQIFISLGMTGTVPSFQFDIISWPMVMTVFAAINGALIVSSARIGLDSNEREWAGILLLGALGISACLSDNLMTSIIIIGLFDLLDLLIILSHNDDSENSVHILIHSSWRLISIIFLMAAYAWQLSFPGYTDAWKSIQPGPGNLILVVCIIRFTLFPALKITGYPRFSKNGIFVVRIIVGFLIAASILLKMSYHPAESVARNLLLGYLWITALISSVWLLRNSEETKAIGWLVFSGSILCAEFVYGFSASGILFSITVVVLIQIVLLVYPVGRYSKIFGILGAAGFSGLPYTPNNTGLTGFSWIGYIPGFIFLFPAILAFWSFFRTLFEKKSVENLLAERWSNFVAPSGLILPVITPWIITFSWLPNPFQFQLSIQALIITFGAIGLNAAEKMKLFTIENFVMRYKHLINNFRDRVEVYPILFSTRQPSIVELLQKPVFFVTDLFEGDGGIIWAVLCLVLVVTILKSFGLS